MQEFTENSGRRTLALKIYSIRHVHYRFLVLTASPRHSECRLTERLWAFECTTYPRISFE